MDGDSGDDELRWLGWEEWEEEWSGRGWRKEKEKWKEVYSKGKVMHNEMSDQWFLKRKMRIVERERVTEDENEFQ